MELLYYLFFKQVRKQTNLWVLHICEAAVK